MDSRSFAGFLLLSACTHTGTVPVAPVAATDETTVTTTTTPVASTAQKPEIKPANPIAPVMTDVEVPEDPATSHTEIQ